VVRADAQRRGGRGAAGLLTFHEVQPPAADLGEDLAPRGRLRVCRQGHARGCGELDAAAQRELARIGQVVCAVRDRDAQARAGGGDARHVVVVVLAARRVQRLQQRRLRGHHDDRAHVVVFASVTHPAAAAAALRRGRRLCRAAPAQPQRLPRAAAAPRTQGVGGAAPRGAGACREEVREEQCRQSKALPSSHPFLAGVHSAKTRMTSSFWACSPVIVRFRY